MASPLKLTIYDRTCTSHGVGLSTAWAAGARLYRGLGRQDASYGATSWADALAWVEAFEPSRSIGEIQYWGHGKWGRIFVDDDGLDAAALDTHARALGAIKERFLPDARTLVWLRTCEAFGANAGIDFAQRLADGLGARVAGHTFIISALQSGLRALAPGKRPTWSATEGISEGTADAPKAAHDSRLLAPRTIHCLTNRIPAAWFAEDGGA